jgi:hypothetical protein
MKWNRFLYFLVFVPSFFAACNPDKVDEVVVPNPADYISITPGEYRIYRVDSVYHDSLAAIKDSTTFYLKEVVDAEIFTNREGELRNFRINRFVAPTPDGPWRILNVWLQAFDATRLERQENNERFIRFQGPVLESTRWNENALNTRNRQTNRFIEIEKPFALEDKNWAKTITVRQLDEFNLIRIERAKEVYTSEIGLVFKQFDTLNTFLNFNPQARPPIRTGVEYKQVLIEYGTE